MARPNREILTGGKRYKEAKKSKHRVEEVTFDAESRTTYLTGFHKRKVERKKNAQKHAEEMARKDRIEERAKIREERKEQVRKKLEEMKAALELNPFLKRDDDDDESDDESNEKQSKKSVGWQGDSDEDEEPWEGFNNDDKNQSESNSNSDSDSDSESGRSSSSVKSILKKQVYEINNMDAPVVGHSEVVIESLDNPNLNVVEHIDLTSIAEQMNVDLQKSGEVLDESIKRAKKYARLLGVADSKPTTEKPKQKKKKFRYLSKTERKVRTMKERAVAAKRSPKGKKERK